MHQRETTVERSSNTVARLLRAARPTAQQGDIFVPEIASILRQRIQDALWQRSYSPEDLLAEITREALPTPRALAVNDRFDWRLGAAAPGCLIAALPPLPPGLEYRFVGADLVLVDIEARLVVDVLPLAIVVE